MTTTQRRLQIVGALIFAFMVVAAGSYVAIRQNTRRSLVQGGGMKSLYSRITKRKPPHVAVKMAPTTTTTPANAPKVYQSKVVDPVERNSVETGKDEGWWIAPPFPDYTKVSTTRSPYKVHLFKETSPTYGTNLFYITLWWKNLPATVDALYLVYDRARFDMERQVRVLIMWSSQNPSQPGKHQISMMPRDTMMTNPSNPVEGALLVYDKRGRYTKDFGPFKHFAVEFNTIPAEANAFLSAVSFFYVENGVGNFLPLPQTFIEGPSPARRS